MNSSKLKEDEIARDIARVFPPILLSFGIPGNILSLIVLVRMMRNQSSIYLIALAGTDLFIICVSLLFRWIEILHEVDFRSSSDVVCKLHIFAVYSSLQISSWILILITGERFCCVIYPHRIRTICTKTRNLISLVAIILCILCLNSHFLFGYHVEFMPYWNTSLCVCKEEFEFFEFKVWPWMDFFVAFAIPCLFLVSGNSLIIYQLRNNLTAVANSIRQHETIRTRENTISFLTKMTISLNTVFIICVSPVSILSIGQPYWWPPETLSDQALANLNLAWTSSNMIMYVNNCVNFSALYNARGKIQK